VMLTTHRRGKFPIAVMNRAEAEATVNTIHERARAAGHPFKCVLQEEVAS
jgi:ATP-dependent Clp protease adapter protein ClpS